jgi:hypothetical protein
MVHSCYYSSLEKALDKVPPSKNASYSTCNTACEDLQARTSSM